MFIFVKGKEYLHRYNAQISFPVLNQGGNIL